MKSKSIFSVIILFFLLGSCGKDFLETSPYSGRSIDNFYRTPEDALEGLAAAYDPIRWGYSNNIVIMSEIASDNCFGGAGVTDDDRLQVWDNFDGTLFINPHTEPWVQYYTGVYRANILLGNIDNVKWGSETNLKDIYTSEARFLRAYYYFDLVRLWGNVPLLTEVLDPDNPYVPQASADDVYKQIAVDLIYAIEHLPATPYNQQKVQEETGGHATKWSAEALLARVFLYYTGYYEKSEIVVDAGTFLNDEAKTSLTLQDVKGYLDDCITVSGHDLVSNYANLWVQAGGDNFAGEDNIETVFAIKYNYLAYNDGENRTWGSNWEVMISPRNTAYGPYANGWGAAPVNPALWWEWPEGDTRKVASIISWDDEGFNYNRSDDKEYTGYNWKKFVPETVNGQPITTSVGADFQFDNPYDKPEIRFADVLLMAAEIHLAAGEAEIAQGYFDRVRDRAFQDQAHRVPVTKQAIMDERRWEFALEGQRYWDLLRQGIDVAKAAIDWNSSSFCYDSVWFNPLYSGDINAIRDINFRTDTKGLFLIPETEISISNGYLMQNTGW